VRLGATIARHPGRVLWPLLILVLLACSIVVFLVVDPEATDLPSRLGAELGSALLGAAIVAISAAFGYYLTQTQVRQRRREQHAAAQRIRDAVHDRRLSIGSMTIEEVVVLEASQPDNSYAEHVETHFQRTDVRPRIDASIRSVLANRLGAKGRMAAAEGKVFDNNDGVDMVSATITGRGRPPESKRNYVFEWTPVKYFDWAVTSDSLQEALSTREVDGLERAGLTLRSPGPPNALRSYMEDPSVRDLRALLRDASPWPAKLGVGVTVVTADEQVLLGRRARATYVASQTSSDSDRRTKLHVVAEGVEPDDLDREGDTPKRAAYRGLAQELGLGAGSRSTGSVSTVIPTAFFIDTRRLQPCFAYIARTEDEVEAIRGALPCARESWEADDIIAMPLDDDSTQLASLLCDTHDEFVLASNHAKAYLYFAMQYRLGYAHMRRLLRDCKQV